MKVAITILSQSLYFVVVYFGVVQGIHGAANIAVFWTAVIGISSLALFSNDVRREISKSYFKNPVVLRYTLIAVKIGVVGIFVWYGWFISAIAYFFHVLMIVSLTAIKS